MFSWNKIINALVHTSAVRSYLDERTLTYEPIVKFHASFRSDLRGLLCKLLISNSMPPSRTWSPQPLVFENPRIIPDKSKISLTSDLTIHRIVLMMASDLPRSHPLRLFKFICASSKSHAVYMNLKWKKGLEFLGNSASACLTITLNNILLIQHVSWPWNVPVHEFKMLEDSGNNIYKKAYHSFTNQLKWPHQGLSGYGIFR